MKSSAFGSNRERRISAIIQKGTVEPDPRDKPRLQQIPLLRFEHHFEYRLDDRLEKYALKDFVRCDKQVPALLQTWLLPGFSRS
jgi:hypothetical protein